MKRSLFVFLWLSCLVAEALAQEASPMSSAQRDFMLCVRRAAVRLEPSGEPASDIASGAVFACMPNELKVDNLILQTANAGTTPADARATAEFFAKAQVEWTRLCRKTKDCAFSP